MFHKYVVRIKVGDFWRHLGCTIFHWFSHPLFSHLIFLAWRCVLHALASWRSVIMQLAVVSFSVEHKAAASLRSAGLRFAGAWWLVLPPSAPCLVPAVRASVCFHVAGNRGPPCQCSPLVSSWFYCKRLESGDCVAFFVNRLVRLYIGFL